MIKEHFLVTVKTYPTLSARYGETVCTAGIRKDGTWIRLYPVQFRRLNEQAQYKKFDWIKLDVDRSSSDTRPETFVPCDSQAIEVTGHVDTTDEWRERRRLVLEKATVFDRLEPLLQKAKSNDASLAVFKPTVIHDFIWEPCERNWDNAKVAAIRQNAKQRELFDEYLWQQTFSLLPKLPYNFSYRFKDADGKTSELQVLDWEAGALYWKCLRGADGNEDVALAKVRQKYFDEFTAKDLHFFLGTTQEFHFRAPNPWVIVGVLPIPHERQGSLF